MHLAYSALQPQPDAPEPRQATKESSRKSRLRYRGYMAACKKYEHEIAAIQQYLPGWQPAFNL